MSQSVEIKHYAVDVLPGGAAVLWHVTPHGLDVLLSRAVTADEMVTALDAMSPLMMQAQASVVLVATAEVA